MIKIVENIEDIVKCWAEAFMDCREDILFFADNVKDAVCIGYYDDNDNIMSMLYLVKCSLGYYIYAACTLKQYQGLGIMTQLLNYCKQKFKNICLIPANDTLVKYYFSRGIDTEISIEDIKFEQIPEINEYLFEGYQLTNPIALLYEGE